MAAPPSSEAERHVRSWFASALPAVLAFALAALGFFVDAARHPSVRSTLFVAAAVIVTWNALLGARARREGRTLTLTIVLRKQHYLQACAQGSVLLYWGWYWRPVYDAAPLIAAQLIFAYAFDMLLSWSRRRTYTLGFGPFPVIFSINLFLWFKPDWFYFPVPHGGRGLRGQGADSLEPGRDGSSTSSTPRRSRSRCSRWR